MSSFHNNSNHGGSSIVQTTSIITKKNTINDGKTEVETVKHSSTTSVRECIEYLKKEIDTLPEDFNLFVKPNKPVEYKLSDCTGRKKSLLIGINYYNTPFQLKGCINDVQNIKNFITTVYGFNQSDMIILTDDQLDPSKLPTRENVIKAMKWLVKDAKEHDSLFLHYSGHGGQVPDTNGDEEDGFDETIMPLDFQKKGQIIDDELHEILVEPLVSGVRLTVVFDCCHSGTVLDLPYIYSTRGIIKHQHLLKKGATNVLSIGTKYLRGEAGDLKSDLRTFANSMLSGPRIHRRNIETKASPADVIMFSGCKDEQTSADAQEAGKATGAMSYALIKSLKEKPHVTYKELLNSVRDILKSKYSQKPQLSASHEMDMNVVFKM